MNRQAITFLTLFSLILVLSIYYILLPPEGEASEVTVNNEELSQIEVLQQNLEKERADLNKTIKVVIDKKEASSSDANSIIKTVMEKTKNEYQVEVKFISETWILS